MTTCSEVTTFSGVTNSSEAMSLSGVIVSLAEVACSAGSTCVKSTGTRGASTEGAGIGAAYTKGACIGDVSTCAGGAYIGAWGADIRDDFIRDTRVGYADGVDAVTRLGIHLRSFRILELKLYSPVLETGVRAG